MMTRMRQMSKFMFIFVGLAFIGLIVFEWGADYSRGSVDNSIGAVNGEKLSYAEFNELYKQLYQNEKARKQGELDERTLEILRNQVWEQFIQRVLFKEQMDKLNISVTDSEVVYQMINHPLDEFKQNPSFQTNGVFDINKYHQLIPTIETSQQIAIENYYRMQIPFKKLQNIITNTVRVSESELKDEYEDQYIKAKVDYARRASFCVRGDKKVDSLKIAEEAGRLDLVGEIEFEKAKRLRQYHDSSDLQSLKRAKEIFFSLEDTESLRKVLKLELEVGAKVE